MSPKTFSFPMSKKTANHMRAPHSASFVAAMRNVFGNENVEVIYVNENDLQLGEPSPAGAPCIHGGSGEPLAAPVVEKKSRKKAA
jgi:hypothetical protein